MSISDNPEDNKIVDEVLKRISQKRIGVSELDKRAAIKMALIGDLVKHVLFKIVENNQSEVEWAVSNGAPVPTNMKILFGMQGILMIFIQELIDTWTTTSGHMMSKDGVEDFKNMLNKFEAEDKKKKDGMGVDSHFQ
jgi:hypothetical protein